MSEFKDFITGNVTDVGGALGETEFFAAMDGLFKWAPQPSGMVVSTGTIRRAMDDAGSAEREADRLRAERARTRRWRVFKRARLAAREAERLRFARALLDTFAPRKYPAA